MRQPPSFIPLRRLRAVRRDGGVVAILTAMLMLVFLGFCAFSVDVGHWYLVREQTQKAADAAALAAVVNLPDNFGNAQTTAQEYASSNGLAVAQGKTSGAGRTTVTTTRDPVDTGRLSVTVSTTVSNFFSGLFGVGTSTISSTGSAAYVPPVKMGSPCNVLGFDPEQRKAMTTSSYCPADTGRMWLNANAPDSTKPNGDPFLSKSCDSGTLADGCASRSTVNPEWRPEGYFYDVTVKRATRLTVSLFDPVWADTGFDCSNGLVGIIPLLKNLLDPNVNFQRYATGSSSPFCTGDAQVEPAYQILTSLQSPTTTFTLRSSSGSAIDPASHATIDGCTKTYGGYSSTNVLSWVDAIVKGELADDFHKWTPLCTIDATPGTYVLQVQTARAVGFLGQLGATNHFSIRGTGSSPWATSGISVSGHETMGLFANDPDNTSEFYLARVPSSAAGQTLKVRFFDLGDCGDGNGSCHLSVLSPVAGGGTGGKEATGCKGTGAATVSSCGFVAQHVVFDGRWETLTIPVPTTYSCDDAVPTDCWYKVAFSGASPHDVTAWTAEMDGQPVRLVS